MARTVGSAAEETRRRILDTATKLFAGRGYAGTSIRDISEQLGMTKGSLYYHFASKEDLLFALLEPCFDALDAFVAAARSRVGALDQELVSRLVDVLDEHAPVLRPLVADPTVHRAKIHGHLLPERLLELQRVISGSPDQGAMLRARCALAVINSGVLAPHLSRFSTKVPSRLSADERRFVIEAAVAVLSVPAAVMDLTP
jgi:AcrR family transcriptional regulator